MSTSGRCPRCAALVEPEAPWCTLCYVDLRAPVAVGAPSLAASAAPAPDAPVGAVEVPVLPAAALVPAARAAEPEPEPVEEHLLDRLLGEHPLATPAVEPPAERVGRHRAGVPTAAARPALWPCTACDAEVPVGEMSCPRCGTAFLRSEPATLVLPLVGDVLALSRGRRLALGAVAALGVALLLLLLASLVGVLL